MAEPIRYESTPEPLDEEERELMDPEHWDWDSAEVVSAETSIAFEVGLLFSPEEYQALASFAERQSADPTEAARRIILELLAAEHQPREVAVMRQRTAG